jgi:hypothetical protein
VVQVNSDLRNGSLTLVARIGNVFR